MLFWSAMVVRSSRGFVVRLIPRVVLINCHQRHCLAVVVRLGLEPALTWTKL